MDLHANAALSWSGRRELARRVVDQGWTLTAAASAAGVSVRCARKWAGRYRAGDRQLCDRSSAPRRVANRTPQDRVAVIALLRRLRMTAAEIAEVLGMPHSTVSAVLKRQGLGRLGRIGLEPARRVEHSPSSRVTASRSNGSSPTTAAPTSQSRMPPPAERSGSATSAPGHVGHRPTARPSASSARCSTAGLTPRSIDQAPNAPPPLTAGSGTTTIDADTRPSATNRPSLEPTPLGLTPSRRRRRRRPRA
jgi:transposase